jgi:hypothetical protein
MTPAMIVAISELAKLGLSTYLAYMQQAGLTEAQIEAVYQEAKKGMLARDPANIPAA